MDKYLRYQMFIISDRGQAAIEEHQRIFQNALKREAKQAKKELKQHTL